jgi:hypothetical protein
VEVIGDLIEPRHEPPRRWRARLRGRWQLMGLRRSLGRASAAEGRRLVWFGNHGSPNVDGGMQDLESIHDLLDAHHRERPLSLSVISNSAERFHALTGSWRFPCHYLAWSSANFDDALTLHDVALIPVRPTPFTLCKTANRVATAALHGLAVAADTIPAYEEFRGGAVLDDWCAGLAMLMNDPASRAAAVSRVCALLEREYAPAVVCARWLALLQH